MDRSALALALMLSILIAMQFTNFAFASGNQIDNIQVTNALNKFSTSLYKAAIDVSGKNQNVVMSPLSVYIAAAMCLAGARRNTAQQIENVLRLNQIHNETAFNAVGNLTRALKAGADVNMRAVNLLFVASGYHLKPEFQSTLRNHFGAEAQSVDFGLDATRLNINKQVEEFTNHKIKELIPPKSMDSSTRMALVTAVYFKSDWYRQFDIKKTRKRPFYIGSLRKKVMMPMMKARDRFRVADLLEFDSRVLELPYTGNQSMLIILPNRLNGLLALESKLATSNNWMRLLDKRMKKQKLAVAVPRFKIQGSFDLKKALINLGMTDLFDYRKADLSGMSHSNELFVSDAFHKAFIEVNERGTEAAAATAMIITSRRWRWQPEPFIADHPFIFIIRDNEKKSILFMGRLTEPTPK